MKRPNRQRQIAFLCVLIGCWLGNIASFSAEKNRPAEPLVGRTVDGKVVYFAPGQHRLTVFCFLGTQCPMARSYVPILNEIHRRYAPRGVQLVGVMSNVQDSADEVARYCEELQPEFLVVLDPQQQIADHFGATRTPEAFLLDADYHLRYHGRIDDRFAPGIARTTTRSHDLQRAIDELLAGRPVSVKATRALGCIIGRLSKGKGESVGSTGTEPVRPNFFSDVFPILRRHCIECHRQGEIGPFGMESYGEVVGWAETMLEVIDQGRMPPWHADPRYGQFANARHFPQEAREVLARWIEIGKPRGPESLAEPLPPVADGWQLPEPPQHVFAMRDRPFQVPARGVVDYQYFVVETGFDHDVWVRAAQVVPGARDVVHHAIVFVRPPDHVRTDGIGWLAAYVPGQRAMQLPPGYARRIPAGSTLVFQMHYTPNGMRREDITRVGLLLADPGTVTHEVFTTMAINQDFEIPPRDPQHVVEAAWTDVPSDCMLLAITPHMHFRGKSFTVFRHDRPTADDAQAATGTAEQEGEILLHVPRYDFNWQHTYVLAEPMPLDGVDRIAFRAVFDNSPDNPFNPDPDEWVHWGDQSWEEMAVVFFEIARPLASKHSTSQRSLPNDRPTGAQSEGQGSTSQRDLAAQRLVNRMFEQLDHNRDNRIRKSECGIYMRHFTFDSWDQNGDGTITPDEALVILRRRVAHQEQP